MRNKHANKGTIVECVDLSPNDCCCGHNDAMKHLQLGETYTIEATDVQPFYTRVFLQEIPKIPFNADRFIEVQHRKENLKKEDASDWWSDIKWSFIIQTH